MLRKVVKKKLGYFTVRLTIRVAPFHTIRPTNIFHQIEDDGNDYCDDWDDDDDMMMMVDHAARLGIAPAADSKT